MGHSVDKLNYLKFHEYEPEYVLENAKIASKYLNIISKVPASRGSDLWTALLSAAEEDPKGLERFIEVIQSGTWHFPKQDQRALKCKAISSHS